MLRFWLLPGIPAKLRQAGFLLSRRSVEPLDCWWRPDDEQARRQRRFAWLLLGLVKMAALQGRLYLSSPLLLLARGGLWDDTARAS